MIRDRDYEYIRKLVYERSRIDLGPDKRELVTARLNKRLRATKIPTIEEYCRILKDQPDNEEVSHLIDVISTNHTYFFRETEHFEYLQAKILPEMLQRRKTTLWPCFNMWSAACSSGEEPYSIAITMADYMQKNRIDWSWHIEATDISSIVLQKARLGIYREDLVAKVPNEILHTYFQKGFGPQAGNYRVKPHLAETVTFHQLNILENDPPVPEPFQVIFCRNVMIYFDHPTQQELVQRLIRRLMPGGYLFVGHAESLTAIRHGLEVIRPAIYRRPLT